MVSARINFLFSSLVFLAAVSTFLHVLKVAHINVVAGALVFYVGFPIVLILTWLCLLTSIYRGRVPVSLFVLTIIFFYAVFITFLYGGNYFDILGNLTRLLFCMGMFFLAFARSDAIALYLIENEKIISLILLGVMAFSIFLMYIASMAGFSVYFGLQSTILFVPLAYGLVYRKFGLILIALALIILSGKRGSMLGAVGVFSAYFFALFISGRIRLFLALLLFFILITGGVFYFDLLPSSVVARFSQFTSGEAVDWNRATAGRMSELDAVFELLEKHPNILFFGSGLGAAIEIGGTIDSTVHFSPFGLMIIFGAPLAMFLYVYLFSIALRGLWVGVLGKQGGNKHLLLWSLVLVGEMFFSFTAFTILQSYMLWISIAAVGSFSLRNRAYG